MAALDAWIREGPPGVTVLAGYFVLQNHGEASVALVGAESAAFGTIEMHQAQQAGGVARMRRLERLVIEPGGQVAFEPGGRHLMLFNPEPPVRAGDAVPITLLLDGGVEIEVEFTVRRP